MNEYAKTIMKKLLDSITEVELNSREFVVNPEIDFTRKRKLEFKEMIRIMLSMGGQSLNLELLDYFSYDVEAATCSAFVQQRRKLLPALFETLFHDFTSKLSDVKYYDGYRMLAVDGSDLNITYNPDNIKTYHPNGKAKGFNLLHLNAMYDLCNLIYVDSIIQPNL